jgi:hypothetical protein
VCGDDIVNGEESWSRAARLFPQPPRSGLPARFLEKASTRKHLAQRSSPKRSLRKTSLQHVSLN